MSGHSGHEYSQYAADFQFVMDPALPANASEQGQLNSFDTYFPLQAQGSPSQQIECSDSTQYYHNRRQAYEQRPAQRDSAQYYRNRPEHFPLQARRQQIKCSDSTQYYYNRRQAYGQRPAQRDSAQYYHNRPEPPEFASSEKISQPRFQAGQKLEPSVSGYHESGHYSTDESISQQRALPREIIPKQDPRTISKARSELSHQQSSTFAPSYPQKHIPGIDQGTHPLRPTNQNATERGVMTFINSDSGAQFNAHGSQYKYYHQRSNTGDNDASF
ncbi:hypothetical protein MYU51_020991 [Penicillium brevicompactum]